MSSKLTLSAFTRALATLGAVSVSACGGAAEPAASPVDAKEVPAATEAAPSAEAPAADAPPTAETPAAGMAPASSEPATPAPAADATGARTLRGSLRRLRLRKRSRPQRRRRPAHTPAAAPAPAGEPLPGISMTAERIRGVGLGLRWEFLEEVLEGPPLDVAFFEVSPENYMRRGGYYPAALERIGERYPLVTHGLTLSLGSADEPDAEFVRDLLVELERLEHAVALRSPVVHERGGTVLHELLPLPFDAMTVTRVADRLRRLSDAFRRPLAVENITYYAPLGARTMSEAEFVTRVVETSGASLLLDVNNVYVNAQNFGFDPLRHLAELPLERVVEIHVAGHSKQASGLLIDTHGTPVSTPVLELLEWTLERTGPVPVLLERDNDVPALGVLLEELATPSLALRSRDPSIRCEREGSCGRLSAPWPSSCSGRPSISAIRAPSTPGSRETA